MPIDTLAERRAAGGVVTPELAKGVFWRRTVGGVYYIEGGASTWALEVDFDRDGSYETDLTAYVSEFAGGWTISRGMGPDGVYQGARLQVGLNNNDARFTPDNPNGAHYGSYHLAAIPIRLTANHNTVDYTLMTGYIDAWSVEPGPWGGMAAKLTAFDLSRFLQDGQPLYLTAQQRTTDEAIEDIATAYGLAAGDLDLEPGAQTLPLHFVFGQRPLEAMHAVMRSEMAGQLWIGDLGKIRFEARNTRLGVTPTATWGDGTNVIPSRVRVVWDRYDYVTRVDVQQTVLRTGADEIEVLRSLGSFDTGDAVGIAAGATYRAVIPAESAVDSIVTPVADRDYRGNSAADGSGTDQTSDLTVTATLNGAGEITFTVENAGAGTVYFEYVIRGVAVEYSDRAIARAEKTVSGVVGGRELSIDVPFAGGNQLQGLDFAVQTLRSFRHLYPRVELEFDHDTDDNIAAMLAAEIGQRIAFADEDANERSSYVNDVWYIERIEHRGRPARMERTTVTLIPSYLFRDLDRIAYDDFARDNATGDLGTALCGTAWSGDGNMDIVSGKARANSDSLQMPVLDLGGSDNGCQVVEVDIAAIGTGDEVGVVFQYTDADNQYRCYLDKGSNELILEKNVATVVTEITSPAFTVGTAHELKVLRQGTRIRVYVDGVLRIDTTDSAFSTGNKVGLFARNASGTATFAEPYGQGV